MKNIFIISFILIFMLNGNYFAQQKSALIDSVNYKFENFEYIEVIHLVDKILSTEDTLSSALLLELYLIKGTSHFTLQNRTAAQECFIKILSIDSSYTPVQTRISPKVISFYNEVKNNFLYRKNKSGIKNEEAANYRKLYEENLILKKDVKQKDALIRSIAFPGWGQLSQGSKLKGWILTSVGFISLCSSIYFIVDANKKEQKYLNELDDVLIQSKFSAYNRAYKYRNYSITIFSTTWLYGISDILFFSK